jgi:hypothetical protein
MTEKIALLAMNSFHVVKQILIDSELRVLNIFGGFNEF